MHRSWTSWKKSSEASEDLHRIYKKDLGDLEEVASYILTVAQ